MNAIQCRTCGVGSLDRVKFQRSGCAVGIGYLILVPSIMGMIMGVFMVSLAGNTSDYGAALDVHIGTFLIFLSFIWMPGGVASG